MKENEIRNIKNKWVDKIRNLENIKFIKWYLLGFMFPLIHEWWVYMFDWFNCDFYIK